MSYAFACHTAYFKLKTYPRLEANIIYSNYRCISELNIPVPDAVCFKELCTRLLGASCFQLLKASLLCMWLGTFKEN